MPLLILLLIIVVPIVEIYFLIQVGQAIGVWWTIVLLVADSILGGMLMRAQGRRAWRGFTEAIGAGRVPAKETLDGGLVILGGAFLLTPGFVSDVFGFALLAPPTRAILRRMLLRRFTSRFTSAVRGGAFTAGPGGPRGPRPGGPGFGAPGDADVEGTAYEVDPPTLPPRPR